MSTQTQPQSQQTQTSQVDKRAIVAIARAVEKNRSFVVWYGDIFDALRDMIEDDDEFHEVEEKLYEDVVDGRIKGVYRFWGTCDSSECDIVVVAPFELNESQLKILEELAQLYSFRGYDGDEDEREELTLTLHNLIKKWASGCLHMPGPAEAVYELAKNHGLEIEEEEDLDEWYVGQVFYRVEGLDTRVVKDIGYCNDCIDHSTGQNFIEKCRSWHFEGDED